MDDQNPSSNLIYFPLTRGYFSVIDEIDIDFVECGWYAKVCNKGRWVGAERNVQLDGGKRGKEFLHRLILARALNRELLPLEYVDHINTIALDNRRGNLRLATKKQNASNVRLRIDSVSGYKGVTFNKYAGRWQAQIGYEGRTHFIGYFDSAELAHEAYAVAARERFGEFTRLE